MSDIRFLQHTPDHLRALIEGVEVYQRCFGIRVADGVRELLTGPEVSAEFLTRLNSTATADPWKDGFGIVHVANSTLIGFCSFTGPPGTDGTVEMAYGIAPAFRSRGYAGEAARALISYAFSSGSVQTVCAHTLPEHNASTRILQKCGLTFTGEVIHPEDGLIWRWEMQRDGA